MNIQDVKVKNFTFGKHSSEGFSKLNFVQIFIKHKEKKRSLKVDLGERPTTKLYFFADTYFGILTNRDLELRDFEGKFLTTLKKPEGNYLTSHEDLFIIRLDDNLLEAYDKSGNLVAKGVLIDEKQIHLEKI